MTEDPYVFLNRIANNCMALDAQGYIAEANGGRLEHDDDNLLPEREDLDDKADRLYDEQEINMEDDKC